MYGSHFCKPPQASAAVHHGICNQRKIITKQQSFEVEAKVTKELFERLHPISSWSLCLKLLIEEDEKESVSSTYMYN